MVVVSLLSVLAEGDDKVELALKGAPNRFEERQSRNPVKSAALKLSDPRGSLQCQYTFPTPLTVTVVSGSEDGLSA